MNKIILYALISSCFANLANGMRNTPHDIPDQQNRNNRQPNITQRQAGNNFQRSNPNQISFSRIIPVTPYPFSPMFYLMSSFNSIPPQFFNGNLRNIPRNITSQSEHSVTIPTSQSWPVSKDEAQEMVNK